MNKLSKLKMKVTALQYLKLTFRGKERTGLNSLTMSEFKYKNIAKS